jgi:hypothetical protein
MGNVSIKLARVVTALTASACLAVAGVPPVLKASQRSGNTQVAVATHPRQIALPRSADLDRLRAAVEAMRRSADDRVKREGQRLSSWLTIATAKTPSDRHEAIRQLDVTTLMSRPGDGRVGVLMTYVAKGKPRVQRFVAGMTLPDVSAGRDQEAGGPRERAAAPLLGAGRRALTYAIGMRWMKGLTSAHP